MTLAAATREGLWCQPSHRCSKRLAPQARQSTTATSGLAGRACRSRLARCLLPDQLAGDALAHAQAALRARRHKRRLAPLCPACLLLPGIGIQITWQRPVPHHSIPGPNAKVLVCKQPKSQSKHLPLPPLPAPRELAGAAIAQAHRAAPHSCAVLGPRASPEVGHAVLWLLPAPCQGRAASGVPARSPGSRDVPSPWWLLPGPGRAGGQGEVVVQTTRSTPHQLLASALALIPGCLPRDPWLPACLGHTQPSWPMASHRQPRHRPGPPAWPQLPRHTAWLS